MTQIESVTVDGVAHKVEELSEQQKFFVNQLADIGNKIGAMNFQLQQLQAARGVFFEALKASFSAEPGHE